MVKRIVIIVDDPDISTSEHYEDILAEELTDTLAERRLQLISLKIEKGSQEQEPES